MDVLPQCAFVAGPHEHGWMMLPGMRLTGEDLQDLQAFDALLA